MTEGTTVRVALAAAVLLSATAARAGDNVMVSGSVYVDYWGIPDREAAPRAPKSMSPEVSLKVQVDVHDDLSASVKACAMCHGIELEHAFLDYTPTTWFNVQAGRLAVPFGEYSQRVDPSGHATASAPLIYDMGRMAFGEKSAMNLGIVPQPYTDTGVLVYGVKWLGPIQTWYGVYGVAGLRGSNDIDWMSMRTLYYTDNNDEPSVGGRLALTLSSDGNSFFGDLSVGASGSAGRYDREGKLEYAMWGADASVKLGPFTFRGEYAARRTDLDPKANYRYELVDTWFKKEGWYGELEHPLGAYLKLVYRYDELRRAGVPLPGANQALTPDSRIVRYSAGIVLTPAQNTYMKAGFERWDTTDFSDFDSYHVGFGGAF